MKNLSGSCWITSVRCLLAIALCVSALSSATPAKSALAKRGGLDIDGNGKSALIVRSPGAVMQVGRLVGDQFQFSPQADPGAAFRFVGATDFDGNGKSDFVFQNTTQGTFGDVRVWTDFQPAGERLLRSAKPVWEVQAVGDLDGDGLGDLVWRYVVTDSPDTGTSYIWFSNGSGVAQVRKRGGAPLTWTLLGAVDLNGDNAADMIYVGPQGQIRILMATAGRTCANLSGGTVPSGYTVLKAGDFSGNRRGDILLRDPATGQMGIVSFNAAGVTLPPPSANPDDPNASCTSTTLSAAITTYSLPVADPTWQFYGAGDYNGDGIDDVVWRRPGGQLTLWLMKANGAAPTIVDNAGTAPSAFAVYQENGLNRATTVTTSFARLQTIFASSCTSCHTAGHPYAAQSGLVLDPAVAYDNLVNAPVKNGAAVTDAMKQVMPGNIDKSLLYQKLLAWNNGLASRYGSPMPLGGNSLSIGQLEFVKRWIEAGASKTDDSVDATLLDDKTLPSYAPFEPLAAPAQGYQLQVGPFPVQPDFERELFVYRRLGNTAPIYVSRIETKMRVNSHHQLLYTFDNGTPASIIPPFDLIRDIRNPDSTLNLANMQPMGYHTFFGGSMTPVGGYTFPVGVAMQLPANAALDFNVHYVNTGTSEIVGEAFANLYTIDVSQVQHVAKTLNLANTSQILLPNQRTTVSKSFTFSTTTRILMLTSHTHKLGEKFVVRIKGGARNGEIVYQNTDWESPAIVTFDQPIVLQAGEGLTSEITYNNTTSHIVTFGLTSEDEMGIIFGYYY